MDRRYIDDHHVVARYLADQLPDAEREAFEAYYLAHPEIVPELEAAARLKVGLAQLKESGELRRLLAPQPRFLSQRYLAAAAGIAVMAIGAVLWFNNHTPSLQPLLVASATELVDSTGTPLPLLATHAILRTRSASSFDASIELPAEPQAIALRVMPELEPPPLHYRLNLSSIADDDSTRPVAAIGNLTADTEGWVLVYVDSTRLPRGQYQIVISRDDQTSAENDTSSFRIRVIDSVP